jgi:hypothetical protein
MYCTGTLSRTGIHASWNGNLTGTLMNLTGTLVLAGEIKIINRLINK